MKKATVLIVACALVTGANAESVDKQCNIAKCEAGTKVKSYAKKDDPYFACQSMELSEYTNYVLGLVGMTIQFTGHMPNISSITGEPEQEGQSKALLDMLRSKAKVGTFDQALGMCEKGKNGMIFMVANNPKNESSIWVFDAKRKLNFWVPKAHMDKQ